MRNTLKMKDLSFIAIFNKPIPASSKWFLDSKYGNLIANIQEGQKQVSKILSTVVSRTLLRELRYGCPISEQMMEVFCKLFRKRDDRIYEAHTEVHQRSAHYAPFKRSLYLPYSFMEKLIENPLRDDLTTSFAAYFPTDWSASHTQDLFVIVKSQEYALDPWTLIKVNISSRKIFFFDPRIDAAITPVSEATTAVLNQFQQLLSPFLNRTFQLPPPLLINNDPWQCFVHQHNYLQPLQNDFDSGIYVTASLYFMAVSCPIYFTEARIHAFRDNLGYWILLGALPV